MNVVVFASQGDAEYHARALGFADEYVADKGDRFGARPSLPRCDGPAWGDPIVVQSPGKHPICSCVSREDPEDDCVYATRAHADVLPLPDGTFAVAADAVAQTQDGKRVRVGATDVDVVTSGARALTRAELDFLNPPDGPIASVWVGDTRTRRATL